MVRHEETSAGTAGPSAAPAGPDLRARARAALALADGALLAGCEETFFVGGGPGGQHRNKTESGVRLRHALTGVVVTATERRSQAQNRAVALERLRARLEALGREPVRRRPTRRTRASQRRRVETKRRLGQKKRERRGDAE
jgi:protein subunit release factor B